MKRLIAIRNLEGGDAHKLSSDLETHTNRKYSLTLMRLMGFFVVSFMLFSVLFSLTVVLRDPPSDAVPETSPTATVFQVQLKETGQGICSFQMLHCQVYVFLASWFWKLCYCTDEAIVLIKLIRNQHSFRSLSLPLGYNHVLGVNCFLLLIFWLIQVNGEEWAGYES